MLRVVIVDRVAASRQELSNLLKAWGYSVPARSADAVEAEAAVQTHRPDAVIFALELLPESGPAPSQGSTQDYTPAIVALIDAGSDPEMAQRAAKQGVAGYIGRPFQKDQVCWALELAVAVHRNVTHLRDELESTREKLETRVLLDRAKSLLIQAHQLSEAEAFRRIQQQSMNTRKSMKEVAQSIIANYNP